ncbi:MAG: oligosaccharide repeat unit polymerase [Candidatus Altimarinota bacterium]
MVTFLLILLTIGTYYLVRDIFHPAFIMLFFWTTGFFLMGILPGFYFPSLETQVIIFVYLFIFLSTSIITTYIFKIYSTKDISFKNKKIDSVFLNVLIVLCTIALMYYVYQRVILVNEYSSLREYFFNIRLADLEGNPLIATSSLMQMFKTTSVLISIVIFYLINISKYNNIKKTYYVSFIVLVQIASLIEGSRNEFIMMTFSYILIDFLHNPKSGSEIAFCLYGKIGTIAKNETDGF